MILERFEERGLAQYSYAVGCEAARVVAIVDPRRDVDVYLEWLAARRFELAAVLDTHVHADYASGARELAARTGARLLLSAHDAGERYEVAFAHEPIAHGEALALGRVTLVALHTPGHTPEHLSLLVYDGARSTTVPIALLSGDFLFVGSLGRPDLLGDEVKAELARALYRSVKDVLGPLPDGLEIHPGHGAGSLCGAGMSGRPFSTLGFERIANVYLDPNLDEAAFVARILSGAPPVPPFFPRLKELNARGPRLLGELPGKTAIDVQRFRALVEDGGHVVVDGRDQVGFGGGHVPGAFGLGLDNLLSTWAGWALPADARVLLVGGPEQDLEPIVRALVRVGIDDVVGHLAGGFAAWASAGLLIATLPQIDAGELARRLAAREPLRLVDVRETREFRQGHAQGALHVFGGDLLAGAAGELPPGPVALMCGSGFRSTVVTSALQRAGRRDLYNVTGGLGAWRRAGLPVEVEHEART